VNRRTRPSAQKGAETIPRGGAVFSAVTAAGAMANRANRDTDATAAAAGENDASVTIRLLISTPVQRVSLI
jgi:hypothetical protein